MFNSLNDPREFSLSFNWYIFKVVPGPDVVFTSKIVMCRTKCTVCTPWTLISTEIEVENFYK